MGSGLDGRRADAAEMIGAALDLDVVLADRELADKGDGWARARRDVRNIGLF